MWGFSSVIEEVIKLLTHLVTAETINLRTKTNYRGKAKPELEIK